MYSERERISKEKQSREENDRKNKPEPGDVGKLYEELEKEQEEVERMLKKKEAELEELGTLWKGESAEKFKREMVSEYENFTESVKSDLKAVYLKMDELVEDAKTSEKQKEENRGKNSGH